MLLAQRRAAEQEILCCQKELAAYEARTELLPLSRDLNARQVALAEQEIKQWQDLVNRRRQQEAEQQVRQAAWEAGQALPAVRQLAEENAALAAKRKPLAERIADATRQQDQVNQQLAALKDQFKRLQEKVEATGKTHATNAIGLLLRKQREALPNLPRVPPGHRRPAADHRRGPTGAPAIAGQPSALANLDLQTQAVLQSLNVAQQAGNRAELEAAVREALKTERDYLDALITDHNTYFDKLVDLANAEQQLVDETERCARYIDERVLWIASADAAQLDDVRWAGDALWWLAGPEAWLDVGADAGGRRRAEPGHFRPGIVRLSRLVVLAAAVPRPHPGDRREGVAGKLLPLPADAGSHGAERAGGGGLAGLDVVFRLAAELGCRRLGVVQGPGGRIAGHGPGLPRPGTAAADVLGRRAGRGPFRLVGRGHETAAAEHPLVQPAGAGADVRGGDDGLAGERPLGRLAGAGVFRRGAVVLFAGACTAFFARGAWCSRR